MNARAERNALDKLVGISTDSDEFFQRLAGLSEKAATYSSESLFGTLGGGVALAIAFGISLAVPGATFVVGATIALAIGIPSGVLIGGRGFRRIRLERRIKENQIAAEEIKARIDNLPPDAPNFVKINLWKAYIALINNLEPPSPAGPPQAALLTYQPGMILPTGSSEMTAVKAEEERPESLPRDPVRG